MEDNYVAYYVSLKLPTKSHNMKALVILCH